MTNLEGAVSMQGTTALTALAAKSSSMQDDGLLPVEALLERIQKYNPNCDAARIRKAYDFGFKAHDGQVRASGEPYFSHPVAVAYSLADMKLDDNTIITAMLHDTVEDTDVTLSDLEKEFGKDVRNLVDGVTKLSKLEHKSDELRQAENFRKLVVAMSEDIRVLLVKLADRLHNMQTIHYIRKPEKRARIAHETLEIYAPLAERIGMRHFKEELQDLSFEQINEEARESIITRLQYLREEGKTTVDKILTELKRTIADGTGLNVLVTGREKKPYSIWKKMEMKDISFEQLSDIMAFRVLVEDVGQCYQVLGAVHSAYHMVPDRFKDYISTPKPNGYRSLHTTVIGPSNNRIEVQIRTHEMHQFAEYGVAAHWSYKQGADAKVAGNQFRWLRELIELLEHSSDATDFLEHTKLEMYHDQVFCFSPKGDVIALPKGSTPVDFAFAVHSAVGLTCVGAKVNGRIVPLRYQLKNGDQVEIHRSKAQAPSPSWERFVVTAKARSEIRRFVRTQQREEYIRLGQGILAKTFRQYGHDLTDKLLEPAVKILRKDRAEDIYADVGEGLLTRQQVVDAVLPGEKAKAEQERKKNTLVNRFKKKESAPSNRHALPIRGLIPGLAVHYAGCCHPIPGDRIVGIVTTGRGVTIHTIDCETLENYTDHPERWLDVAWDAEGSDAFKHVGRLRIQLVHETGALAGVMNVIAQDYGNVVNLKILNRSADLFEFMVDVEVDNVRHLNNIIAALRAKPSVQSVERHSS